MSLFRTLLPLLILLPLAASEAPTRTEWQRITTSLARATDSAQVTAETFLQRFPEWPGTYLALAEYHLERGEYNEAIKRADVARKMLSNEARPLGVIMIAATRLGLGQKALTIFTRFKALDDDGSLHVIAAQAAAITGQIELAAELNAEARRRAGAEADTTLLINEGMLALANERYDQAEKVLEQAAAEAPNNAAAHYNLGLLSRHRATTDQAQSAQHQAAALDRFRSAAQHDQESATIRLAAGLSAFELGQYADASAFLKSAVTLAEGLANERARVALAAALNARSINDDNIILAEQALAEIVDLRLQGALETARLNNLVCAGIGAGQTDPIAIAFEGNDPQRFLPGNRGLAALISARALAKDDPARARTLAQLAYDDLASLAETGAEPAVQRYLGHAATCLADLQQTDDPTTAAVTRDAAAAAYAAAADQGDWWAARFHLAVECARDPRRAYDAALRNLGWNSLDISAWRNLIAFYGPAKAWQDPLHLGIWGALLLISLLLGLRRSPPPSQPASNIRRASNGAVRTKSSAVRTKSASLRAASPGPSGYARQRSAAAIKNERLRGKMDETFLPKQLQQGQQAPLEKRTSDAQPMEHRAANRPKDETLRPGTMIPEAGTKDAGLDRRRKR